MACLSKNDVLSADDIVIEKVPVPEWGGDCYIRTMMSDDRDALDQWGNETAADDDNPNWRGLRARTVAYSLCDEKGELLGFSEAEIMVLGQKSARALDRLFDVSQRINKVTKKGFEELEKNLPGGPNDGPG